uniref:CSON009874 protein n=1 Tax=Culicoides sonorensis TaxID=179676 RepID=A0A336M4U7_CULSO
MPGTDSGTVNMKFVGNSKVIDLLQENGFSNRYNYINNEFIKLTKSELNLCFFFVAIVSPISLLTIVKSKKCPYACRSISDSLAKRSKLPSYYMKMEMK